MDTLVLTNPTENYLKVLADNGASVGPVVYKGEERGHKVTVSAPWLHTTSGDKWPLPCGCEPIDTNLPCSLGSWWIYKACPAHKRG